ncbi:MAG: ABC transporter permease [Clostridia bacterium]|nr:ABC transporter permease [Clostridia bacterium]
MIVQSFKMAIKSIASNKMRSFLTILGVIIGVIAVVVLVAIGQGTTSQVTSSIEDMGTNLLTANIRTEGNNPITMDDLNEVATSNVFIAGIAPLISQSATLKAGNITYDEATIEATTPEYSEIRNYPIAQGRFLKQPDIDNRSFVAVLGTEVAEELFGTRNVVGEEISYEGYVFTIIGVFEEKGSSSTGSNDSKIVIPFTLGERILFQKGIRTFYASAISGDVVDMAQVSLESYLNRVFDDDTDAYSLYSQSEMLDTLSETTQTLTLMLGGIAAISLLVGGIGIMNIMLVSVSERTREIGIRKAIGAARENILSQFLIEALVISLMGGCLGLLIAWTLMVILSKIMGMTLVMSTSTALLAVCFSLMIGVVFGLYPANKASKLKPIDALRYEG